MSVTVIALDRIPASSLGCYGSWQQATPHIDAQAARSLVCDGYYDFHEQPLALSEQSELHLFRFSADDILEEATEEDWMTAAPAWLGDAHAEVDDVPELLEAFMLEPQVLDDIDLTLRLALHATALRVLDRLVGELREELEPHLKPGDVVILLSLCGEPLVEREAGLEEQPQVRPELQHLPLMVECIDPQFRAGRYGAALGQSDVAQLLSALRDNAEAFSSWQQHISQRDIAIHSGADHRIVRTSDWLCVLSHDPEHATALYHQPEDPWALLNVAAQYPHVVDSLRSR